MDEFMAAVMTEAAVAKAEGGIPTSSELVYGDHIIGPGHNRSVQKKSAILHTVMDVHENAGRLSPAIYRASTIYTTQSQCVMCAGAILLCNIPRVVIEENLSF